MSTTGISANRLELVQIAKSVAQEKSIDKSIVIGAIEEAIQRAAKLRYGSENDIRATLNPETGEMDLKQVVTVVEEVENEAAEIDLATARLDNPDAEIGTTFETPLPPMEFGRVQSQMAKQVIMQKVREAERARQYEEYKDRVGEIINGIVKRVEYGHIIVDLGNAEGVIRREQTIPRENVKNGDRIRAYIYDVREEPRGSQIFLSRSHPQFMAALFAQEVPEVYEGIIEIISVARDPGSRAKIAVRSNDGSIDPVGACVGMRGSRVQAVVNELQGERIDIIPWNDDAASFIVSALQPAEVSKVVIDPDENRIEIVVPDDQLSLAIGRRGQNVRLASQLSGWAIDIMNEEQESERRQKEYKERSELFMSALDVDEMIAQVLIAESFETLEEVAYVAPEELSSIEGFDEETTRELQTRAREYLERQAQEQDAARKAAGVEDAVLTIPGVTLPMAVAFGEHDIKTVEDVAGLIPDDLRGYTEMKNGERVHEDGILEKFGLSADEAQSMIMQARVLAGWIDASALEVEDEETEGGDEDSVPTAEEVFGS
ncbi:MAG TPA: transcription termination/antitermination protein NusA [Hellea balneolensis]|uniref:Transcription termination/antitermination protein NusA n=1 Tax=Hellea balneolensis TaxID=287478 RepID=A0A7C5R849_9PROT|nr:transcription termination/antitermination protein NusA [Hellea balneolensis]